LFFTTTKFSKFGFGSGDHYSTEQHFSYHLFYLHKQRVGTRSISNTGYSSRHQFDQNNNDMNLIDLLFRGYNLPCLPDSIFSNQNPLPVSQRSQLNSLRSILQEATEMISQDMEALSSTMIPPRQKATLKVQAKQ
jgi:hypothetical protein